MILQWFRQRYRRSTRDYADGGLIAVVVGVVSQAVPNEPGTATLSVSAATATLEASSASITLLHSTYPGS